MKYQSKDSLGFIVRDGDTLIRVENYIESKSPSVPYEYKDSTFLELYKKIAFQPIHKDSSNTKPMKYWKDDIRIYFSENMSKSVIRDVMEFAHKIDEEVDSLKITKVKKIEDSNYVIYYDTDYEYLNEIKNKKKSDYWISWNGKNQIERGYLRIVKSRMFSEKLTTQKIRELFFGTLGWFYLQDDLDCDNYVANCYSDSKHLTAIDLEILRYHYSYGICKRTSLKTFEAQHRQCKENLRKGLPAGRFIHPD
ncbi:hypothetical protein [Winogradskyella ouciana]|uniref:Uncharacterized protein n=1 Tax=Winogradskyella ouciana TaxID=2608631 RepID=A0A7K1GAV9_9FLAO|nr:hypothetical protein [Winogradskyella ouciana]MTE25518.1 hypothetical protein [Winogradskyella ouciana]